MKLKNKKTGEIGELMTENYEFDGFWVRTGGDNYSDYKDINYYSLAELTEEWEDYEEPSKTIWQIKDSGELQDFEEDAFSDGYIESSKSIGNYFETEEEAEKAVEKLKAWKRLKDRGFKFKCWYGGSKDIWFSIPQEIIDKPTAKDLDLLFGGEE